MEKSEQILKRHQLKCTEARLYVLEAIQMAKGTISYQRLEKGIEELADRVTLYRILKTFEEKGIVHKTIDHKGSAKYALCATCDEHHHHHNHVHFNCLVCNETECFDDIKAPIIAMPKHYTVKEINLTVNGICKKCR
jgi:Fur family ferric uptake transcriptional regulator